MAAGSNPAGGVGSRLDIRGLRGWPEPGSAWCPEICPRKIRFRPVLAAEGRPSEPATVSWTCCWRGAGRWSRRRKTRFAARAQLSTCPRGAVFASGAVGASGSEPARPALFVSRRARVGAACRGHLALPSAQRCGCLRGGRCGCARRGTTCQSAGGPSIRAC